MFGITQLPTSHGSARRPSTEAAESVSGQTSEDDVVLGCECANPALQIDSWQQEVNREAGGE